MDICSPWVLKFVVPERVVRIRTRTSPFPLVQLT
jgi:hypothetical protein